MGTGYITGVKGAERGVDHPSHLVSRLKEEQCFIFTPPLGPRDLFYLYRLYMKLGGPQGQYGRVREISPPQGFDTRIVQPVASRYTD